MLACCVCPSLVSGAVIREIVALDICTENSLGKLSAGVNLRVTGQKTAEGGRKSAGSDRS